MSPWKSRPHTVCFRPPMQSDAHGWLGSGFEQLEAANPQWFTGATRRRVSATSARAAGVVQNQNRHPFRSLHARKRGSGSSRALALRRFSHARRFVAHVEKIPQIGWTFKQFVPFLFSWYDPIDTLGKATRHNMLVKADLNDARTSSVKYFGCSHAAKWQPLGGRPSS